MSMTQKITSRFFDRVLNRKLTWNEPFGFQFKTQNREINFSALLSDFFMNTLS